MARMKEKARTWHLKGALGIAAVFVAGLFVSGAFGGVSPLGLTASGTTDTGSSSTASTGTTSSQPGSTVPYIVTFADGTSSSDQTSEIAAAGAVDVSDIAPLSMHSIDVPADSEAAVVAALQANANVVDVERDRSRETDAAPDDPGYADQWNLPLIGWDQIYGSVNPLGSSTIAVLDTGVSGTTGDLHLGTGWSAFGTDPTQDANGHGTAVASIAAATAGNGIGIAGVDFGNPTILPVQVLDSNGLGQDSDIIQGVVWAADHGANVILMSFSNPGFSQALQDAVDYAWGKGAVVVAATGNDGVATPTYPAGDADVMGVAGTDQSDQPWSGSNTGADTFIAAPATQIPAEATDGSETSITGTSASAAEVAGAAALLLQNDPNATNAIVDGRLARNADPVGTADQTGNGRLDLARAAADTSTDAVTPLGAPGGGGPIVGPYKAASNATVSGTVKDSSTNNPIAGATLTCTGGATCTGTTLANGSYSVTVNYGGAGPVTATLTASATGYTSSSTNLTCSGNGNGTCTPPNPVNFNLTPNTPVADLSVTKTDNKGGSSITSTTGSVVAGTAMTYTVKVSNAGPSTATGASVTDSFPANFTGATWTATQSGGATGFTASGSGNISDTVTMPSASTITYTVTGTVKSSAGGTLSNTATVAAPSGTTDPTPGNNSATDNDSVTKSADLSVTKTDNKGGSSITSTTGSVAAGAALQYTVKVSNAGPSDAVGASVTDTLPANFTGATWTATGTTGTSFIATGSGNINDTVTIPSGGSITYTVNGSVKSSATGTLSNTASAAVASGTTDPTSGNNSATDNDTITQSADLAVTKTDNKGGSSVTSTTGSVAAGSGLTYTVTVSNAGPSDAVGATVTDNFPPNFTGATWTATGTTGTSFTASGSGNLNNTVTIPSGGSITYTITGTVKSSATGTLSNTATVTAPSGTTDPTAGNNSATDTDTVSPSADLSVTKTDNKGGSSITSTTGSVVAGTGLTYTVTVSNAGPSDAVGAKVTDNFPSDFTGASWTAVGSGGATGFTASGSGNISDTVTMPAGSTITYTVTGTVKSSASGTLQNTASASVASGTTDPTPGNNSATDSDTVTKTADLSITKTDNKGGSVVAGTGLTYTVKASNAGPSDAVGASVTDSLPSNFTGATWTATGTSGTSFTASGSGSIDDTVTIPSGGSITYTITGTVKSSATGTLSNTATVAAPNGTTDAPGNNSATDNDTITQTADLSVVKSDDHGGNSATSSTGSVVPGTGLTYTVTVANSGPSDSVGATIGDSFPSGFSGASWTASATGGATGFTPSGSGNINDTANLPAGSTITYTVTGTVRSSATGTLSNTATASNAGGTTDPTPSNNSASDTDNLTRRANVSLSKSDNKGGSSITPSTGTVVPGTSLTYTISVGNSGPSDVAGASVADNFSSQLSGVTWTAAQSGGASGASSCSSSCGNLADTVTIPVGGSIVYTVTGTVKSSATGTLGNTATVAMPSGTTNTGTSSATDTDNLTPQASISLAKTDNAGGSSVTPSTGTVVPGTSLTYTITATNSGPSDLVGGTVSDTFPSDFTGAIWTATGSGGASGFTASGSGNIHDTVNLPVGATVTYTVTGTVKSSATGTLGNTANIAMPSGTTNTGTSSATDKDNLTPQANVSLSKSDNKGGSSSGSTGTVVPGTSLTYTVTVGNSGPSDLVGATVSDTFPSDFTGAAWTAAATGGATGFTASGSGNIDDIVDLPVGSTITYTVTGTVKSSAAGTLSNTATVAMPSGTTNTGTSSAKDDDNLTPQADLSVVKSDDHGGNSVTSSTGSVVPGTSLTYTVTVANSGPSDSVGATISDSFPSGFSGASWTASATGGATGFTASGSGNINDTANLPAGSTITYTVTGTVDSSATGTLSNTATASNAGGTTDPSAGNNSATDSDNLTPQADLGVTKNDGTGTVVAGTSTTYTVTLTNHGPSDAPAGQVVTDPAPAGTTISSSDSRCAISSNVATCTTDAALAAGHSTSFALSLAVDSNYVTAQGSSLTNTASITSSPGLDQQTNPSNDSASDTDTVVARADLGVTKDDGTGTVVAGTSTTYTVTLANHGPSDAPAGQVVTDPAPAGTTISSSDSRCAISSNVATCTTDAALAAGHSTSFALTLAVDSNYVTAQGSSLTNTASITSSPGLDQQTNPSNDSASDTDTVVAEADLSVTKDGPSSAVAGSTYSYTLTVKNNGKSDNAGGFTVSDTLSSELSFVSAGSSSSCHAAGQVVTCTESSGLAAGSTESFTVVVKVDPATTPGTVIANRATVASTGTTDPDSTNNQSSPDTLTTVTSDVSLHLAKSFAPSTVTAGDGQHTFTLKVTNTGTLSTAHAVHVTDTVPASIAVDLVTDDHGGSNCGASAGQSVDCTFALLPAGQTATVTVTYHVDAATKAQQVQNSADAASPDNTASDSANDTLTIDSDVALGLTKTFTPSTVIAGSGDHTFTLTVKNTGQFSTAHAVEITDTVDPKLVVTNVAQDQGANGDCSASAAQSINCTFTLLPAGDTATVTVTYQVDAATKAQSVDNTANAATPDNGSKATDTKTLTIDSDVALSLTKTFAPSSVTAGDGNHTFTLAVKNTGQFSTAHAVEVIDPVNPDLVVTAVHDNQGDTSCGTSSGQMVDCTFALLPAGSTATITVTYHVGAATQAEQVDNTAGATSPDNGASANDTTTLTVTSDVALGLTKTFTPGTVIAGSGDHTFTLTVKNTGQFSTAHAVEITDTVDPKLVVTNVAQDQGANGDCSASAAQSIDCTFTLLPAGDTATVTVTYHVDPATKAQSVDNTANAATPDNGSKATDTKTLIIDSDVALSLTKSFAPDTTVTAGDGQHTFTLKVKNSGTFSTAHDVNVTDAVPAGIVVDAVHDDQGDTNCGASSGQSVDCTFALLPAGSPATITVTYHVDAATKAQSIDNTANAATPDNGATATDTKTLTVASDVALSLAKTFQPDTVTAGDGDHTFTLAVTNDGTFSTAHSVEITDSVDSQLVVTGVSQDQGAGGNCSPASQSVDCTFALLPHGQTATVTVTYHVDPSTSAGTVTNDATATSPDNSQSAPAAATLTIKRDADLSVTKTAATDPTQPNTDETFTVTVKNLGPSDNAGYTLTDAAPAGTSFVSASSGCNYDGSSTVTCTSSGLAFNATDAFTITVHVAADYPHDTKLSNTASIASTATPDSVSADDSSTVTVDVASIDLTKTGSVDETVVPPTDRVDAGDHANYAFRVENTGSVALTNAEVTDALTGTDCTIPSLAPGAVDNTTCSGSYTLSQTDVDNGSVSNTAHVTAAATNGVNVSDDSTATVTLPAAPSVSITKTPTLHEDVAGPADRVDAGDQISYVFTVQNTGNVTLTGVTVTDPLTNTSCSVGTLAPGQTDNHCTATYTLTQADVDLGSRTNTATVTGNPPQGAPVSDDDSATVKLPAQPALQLAKSTQSAPFDHPGQQLDYTYTLTNTGNVTLGGPFAIQDDKSTNASCPASPSSIAPGDSITCTGTYDVLQSDIDAGSVTNHATATANFQNASVTSNEDQATVQAIQNPSVSLTKLATESTYTHVGEVLHYTYYLTNTGNVTLSNPSVTDTNTDAPVAVSNGNNNGKLNVGETWTFTATHTVKQADLDNGAVTNDATGHTTFDGSPVDSAPQSVTVPATQSPSLTLTKVADTATYDQVGQIINYTYTLQNTGNVTLGSPTVTDDNIDFGPDASYFSGDTNSNGKMDPGESWVFKAQHTVTTTDIFEGSIINNASGSAPFTYYGQSSPTTISSNPATATVSNAAADVSITKSASPDPVLVNDQLAYTLTVSNGSATQHSADNVTVSDAVPSGTTFVSSSATNGGTCDSHVTCTFATLAPGASATITIVVKPTSSGQIKNTASVLATESDPDTSNNTASVTTTANARPTTLVYTGDVTQDFNDPFTASAKLTDTTTGNPVAGESVTIKLNGAESCSGTTDGSGVASCSITPGEAAGTYNVTASFAGDSVYAASSAAPTTFTVKHEQTTTTYTGPTGPIQNGSTVTLSGVLKEDGTTPISGRTLTLSLGSQSCTGNTDSSGVAKCSLTVNQPLGPGTAGASFAGDGYYVPSSDSKTTLIYASASGGNGAFVVGDNSATGSVYFWGSQWSTMNSLSGGAAPAAFKGFAKQPGTPSCGASWSTDPGNSAPPPAGPLPSYIAVIVTSKATKSGSQISGNIVHIVVVKVNAGYTTDPGHPGTGTVVATVC